MMSQKLSVVTAAVVLIATPAFAHAVHKRSRAATASYAYETYAYETSYGPNAVVGFDGTILGADPDPRIRFELMRQGGSQGD